MFTTRILTALVILLAAVTAVASDCLETKLTFVCKNINEKNINEKLSILATKRSLKYLKFINSSIPNFPLNVFGGTEIEALYLNNSDIETLQTGLFSGLQSVEEIYLQENRLRNVSRGCFNSLRHLKKLQLAKNNISFLENDCFHGSNDLREIYLCNNKIEFIPKTLFESLENLVTLDLSNNVITNVNINFLPLPNLRNLYLNDNQITKYECDSFKLSSLSSLQLENNFLTEINGSCLPPQIQTMILSKNMINNFDNIYILVKLNILDLDNNNIFILDRNVFKNLNALSQLSLRNNKIKELPMGVFKNLTRLIELSLSKNFLVHLDYGLFSGLEMLETLDLSYNKISYLEEDIFQNIKNLRKLDLSYNDLTQVSLVKLKKHCPVLTEINLIGNNISCQKLSSMIAYKIMQILNGSHFESSNINGIPCTNLLFAQNYSNNIIKENKNNISLISIVSDISNKISNLSNRQSQYINNYLSDEKVKMRTSLNELTKEMSRNNVVFIILILVITLFASLQIIIIIFLRKLPLRRLRSVLEPEMHLI